MCVVAPGSEQALLRFAIPYATMQYWLTDVKCGGLAVQITAYVRTFVSRV